jgi:DNA-directed RNA polymerase subunit M/transcription elongation factor TFIIS
MPWTPEQTDSLAQAYFEGRPARCPACAANLYVKETKETGRASVDLHFDCRRCGETARFANPSVPERWSAAEIRDILEAWRREGEARCQHDRTVLVVQEFHWLGQPKELSCHCRRCGRFFQTEIESHERHPDG